MKPNSLLRPESPALRIPEIDAGEGNLPVVSEQAWSAVQRGNDPPKWFRFGGAATRIVHTPEDEAILQVLDVDRLRHLLARAARWIVNRKDRKTQVIVTIDVPPPVVVVKDLLADPNPPLPNLLRIVRAPVFAPDGSIRTDIGYSASGCCYYWPGSRFSVGTIPSQPTQRQVDDAIGLLINELLPNFPFVHDADRCHAVAILVQPFARDLISGPTPLYVIEKPSPGTGAGLLVEVLTYPSLGGPIPMMTEGESEAEWRKRITARLVSSPNIVVIDNLSRPLDSAALSCAITAPLWEDRLLGVSRTVALPVRCTWIATGNNPSLSHEISRRAIRIRMDAHVDRPWLRTEFRHPLPAWAIEHRPEIVSAVLTIVSGWLAAGRPSASHGRKLGMFEAWSGVMGGILEYCRLPGFLSNLEDAYERSDTEGAAWRRFVDAWWECHGGRDVGVAELYAIACDGDGLNLGAGNEKSQRTKLGLVLGTVRDRQFGRLRVVSAQPSKNALRWHLVVVDTGSLNVGPNVNRAETTPLEPLAQAGTIAGEPGERFVDPSACAHAPTQESLPPNVNHVRHVHPDAKSERSPGGATIDDDIVEFDV